ncbi:MAG: hypothetical protein FWF25_03155 [Propionibacteriaceae bacterium]|nr:hypothetical protein [Propionibacteriaceae bacterium]
MRTLLLTRNTGEGHNRVALAIHQAFESRGHVCEVVDALRLVNRHQEELDWSKSRHRFMSNGKTPAAQAGSELARTPPRKHQRRAGTDVSASLYGWAVLKMPALFGSVYQIGDVYSRSKVPSPIYFQNQKYAEATHTYIEENEYDVVISTHLFPQETLSAVRKRFQSRTKFYGVLTDYSCTPFFCEPKIDGYFVPHPDMMADCVRHGLPRDRTYPLGLPVAERFRKAPAKAEARQSLNLPTDIPVFLLMSGGVGSMYTGEATDRLLADGGENVRVVILTGRREDLFTSITRRYEVDPRVTVVPFTDRVPDYMAAADILLTKPGAVSSTEAAVLGLPLVHTAAIPGGEVKNARFFAERGMSLYNQRPGEAARLVKWLLEDEAKVEWMRTHQKANMIADGADRIVAHIENAA